MSKEDKEALTITVLVIILSIGMAAMALYRVFLEPAY